MHRSFRRPELGAHLDGPHQPQIVFGVLVAIFHLDDIAGQLSITRLSEIDYHLTWTHHHLLLDGWSITLLLKEALRFYEAARRGEDLRLDEPRP